MEEDRRAMITLNFFKFVFLNYLLCFSASYDPLLGKAYNDSGAAIRGMANSLSRKRHKWQLTEGLMNIDMTKYQFHAILVANMGTTTENYCDATIISDKLCITAAVCVFDLNQPRYTYYDVNNLKVIAGATDNQDITRGVPQMSVDHVAAPDDFKENPQLTTFEGGLDLITLKQDLGLVIIQGTFDNIKPTLRPLTNIDLQLKSPALMENGKTPCTAFGSTSVAMMSDSASINNVPLQLYEAKVNLVAIENCYRRWMIYGIQLDEKIHICAVGTSHGVCMGESGGGLKCHINNDDYFVGVSSMQMGCGTHSAPIIFNRMDAAIDFINQASTPLSEKSAQSIGYCIHNQLLSRYYGAPLTSVLLVTLFIKCGF